MKSSNNKMMRGKALLASIFLAGALSGVASALPVPTNAVALSPTDGIAIPGESISWPLADVYGLLGVNLTNTVVCSIGGATYGSATIVSNDLVYTTGSNIAALYGSMGCDGFIASTQAIKDEIYFTIADFGECATPLATVVVSVRVNYDTSDISNTNMAIIASDFPKASCTTDDSMIANGWAGNGQNLVGLPASVFQALNYRNIVEAFQGTPWYFSDLVLGDVMKEDGTPAPWILASQLGVDLAVAVASLQGTNYAAATIEGNVKNIETVLAAYENQPYKVSYTAVHPANTNNTASATVNFSIMHGGSVFKPFNVYALPNTTNGSVVIKKEDIVLNVSDLPDGWFTVLTNTTAQAPDLEYPKYSYWNGHVSVIDNTSVTTNNGGGMLYSRVATNVADEYAYVTLITYNSQTVEVSRTHAQILMGLPAESESKLQASDLVFTTKPFAADADLSFTNGFELAGTNVIKGNWGFPVEVLPSNEPEANNFTYPAYAVNSDEVTYLYDADPNDWHKYDAGVPVLVTEQGGRVHYHGDRFYYYAPRGFDGTDSFTYHIFDGTRAADGSLNVAAGQVTVIVPAARAEGDGSIFDPSDSQERPEAPGLELIAKSDESNVFEWHEYGFYDYNCGYYYYGYLVSDAPAHGQIVWDTRKDVSGQTNANNVLAGRLAYIPEDGFVGLDEVQVQYLVYDCVGGYYTWTKPSKIIFNVKESLVNIVDDRQPDIDLVGGASPLTSIVPGSWVRVWIGKSADGNGQLTMFWNEWLPPADTASTGFPVSNTKFDSGDRNLFFGGGYYEVWVQTFNESTGYGPWTMVESFTLESVAPSEVLLISPIDGAAVEGPGVDYRWNSDENANWYQLWSGKVVGGQTVKFFSKWFNNVTPGFITEYRTGHNEGSYEWYVRPWGPDGMGPWSLGSDGSFSVE